MENRGGKTTPIITYIRTAVEGRFINSALLAPASRSCYSRFAATSLDTLSSGFRRHLVQIAHKGRLLGGENQSETGAIDASDLKHLVGIILDLDAADVLLNHFRSC